MRVRLEGARSDIHAADGRYHVKCYKSFTNEQNVECAKRKSSGESDSDKALQKVIAALLTDSEKVWNSIEVHNLYIELGGTESNRNRFITELKERMADEIVLLTSPGTATSIMLKSKADSILKLEKDSGQDNLLSEVKLYLRFSHQFQKSLAFHFLLR